MLCNVAEMLFESWCTQHACTFLMTHLEYVERSSYIVIFDLLLPVVNRLYFSDDTGVIFVGIIASLFL